LRRTLSSTNATAFTGGNTSIGRRTSRFLQLALVFFATRGSSRPGWEALAMGVGCCTKIHQGYTRMQLLVRSGAKDPLRGRFLRADESVHPDGSPVNLGDFNTYFVWDLNHQQAVAVQENARGGNGNQDMGHINPALEGTFTIGKNGKPIEVRTLFSLLQT